ncbi:MAG: hypothetical protein LBF81_02165 [Prevotellaceae bacterium]|jgi:hypothetical protein|nr:hypothetical protein [Prevotellaceae bacterium]
MKTKFFFFAMFVSVVASAQTLNIEITTIDYAKKIATCDLSWTARNATHLSDVWVFVDYTEISGNAPTGVWKPAAITGATVTQNTTGSAVASTVSGNTRGVWIKSTTSGANFTGKIALQLNNVPAQFNACAYATDYPPNAQITSGSYINGTYTLKGTKPFIINGASTVHSSAYSAGRIISITDATRCPGYRCSLRDEAVGAVGCCPGLTAVGNYCRDLVADEASTYTCDGTNIEVKIACNNYATWSEAMEACVNMGWRLMSFAELQCLATAGKIINTYLSDGGDCQLNTECKSPNWWLNDCNGCRTTSTFLSFLDDNCIACLCGQYKSKYVCVRD